MKVTKLSKSNLIYSSLENNLKNEFRLEFCISSLLKVNNLIINYTKCLKTF